MTYKDGIYIYFSNNLGITSQPIKLKSIDDIEHIVDEHRNNYDRYLVIKRDSKNGDEPITRGEIEHYTRKRRKR